MTGYIAIDNLDDELKNILISAVQNATVLTINGKTPDENGNIELSGVEDSGTSAWDVFEL